MSKPKSTVTILVAIILVLTSIAGLTITALRAQGLQQALAKTEEQLSMALIERDTCITELASTAQELAVSDQEVDSLSGQLDEALERATSAQDKYDRLLTGCKATQQTLYEVQTKLAASNELLSCGYDSSSFDYRSNSAVSSGLKDFLGDVAGSVTEATWDVLWSNSKTALHTLDVPDSSGSGYVAYKFMAYFYDRPMGNEESIFWVNRTCWLDWGGE